MKFPRIKDIFASRTKFPKLVTSLLADILSKEMRYSGMKTPKSETMTIHTIQIKLYCLMVLEKKRCKKKQSKRRIRTASTISTTSNIENTENMEYYKIRKYALLLMNNDDNRNHITSIK
jgi:hypothetical protein